MGGEREREREREEMAKEEVKDLYALLQDAQNKVTNVFWRANRGSVAEESSLLGYGAVLNENMPTFRRIVIPSVICPAVQEEWQVWKVTKHDIWHEETNTVHS